VDDGPFVASELADDDFDGLVQPAATPAARRNTQSLSAFLVVMVQLYSPGVPAPYG
jgi:hypothetical protein